MTCEKCRYFEDYECHRYPPVVVWIAYEGLVNKWPMADSWCGEYEFKGHEILGENGERD